MAEQMDRGAAQARLYPAVQRALKRRGVDPTSLFEALADGPSGPEDSALQCTIVDVGQAFFVRHVWDPTDPVDTWTDYVLVNDRFERREGLALFAQLLMNGAVDLGDPEDVLRVFETARAGFPVRTRKEAESLVHGYADEKADPDLVQQWEPPHFDGRVMRFCYDDTRGTFGAVTVDVETCAIATERRCKGPVYILDGTESDT